MAGKNLRGAPSLAALNKFNVNRAGAVEAVRQTLYDFQTYAQAGQTSLTFFQVPQGQAGKTLDDTNMEIAGSLPSPKRFLLQSIEVYLFPGPFPSTLGAPALSAFANDVYEVGMSGFLKFFIGSKDYLIEAPLQRFPPKTHLYGWSGASDSTTAGAAQAVNNTYASFAGRAYRIQPEILIEPTQNFNVSLNWSAAVGISADARIGVVLDGILYRNSQ